MKQLEINSKSITFSRPEDQYGVQMCIKEVLKLRHKDFEGAESKLREKQGSQKLPREFQEAPEELPSHDPRSVFTDYELPRSRREPPKSSQRAPQELLESQHGVRRDPKELPRGSEELRKRS